MTEATIVLATLEHARAVATFMRAEDAAEVKAASGFEPIEAVVASMCMSLTPRTLLLGGKVAAMFGCSPIDETMGAAWLLTTDAVNEHPAAFVRQCRSAVASLLDERPVLINAIDARYTAALRWARWLGFEVEEPKPFGAARLPFCRITLRRNPNV